MQLSIPRVKAGGGNGFYRTLPHTCLQSEYNNFLFLYELIKNYNDMTCTVSYRFQSLLSDPYHRTINDVTLQRVDTYSPFQIHTTERSTTLLFNVSTHTPRFISISQNDQPHTILPGSTCIRKSSGLVDRGGDGSGKLSTCTPMSHDHRRKDTLFRAHFRL